MQDPKLQDLSNPLLCKNVIQPKKKPLTDDDNIKGTRAKKKDNGLVENEKKDYVVCHVSFQPTGGTNITSVNALSNMELYVHEGSKGKGKTKGLGGLR